MMSEGHGRRNLIILGFLATFIAIFTTMTELWIYRTSGDIYLDRSRPGYLPDDEEVQEIPDTTSGFHYSDTGDLNKEELKEYLDELKKLDDYLNRLDEPYSAEPLSNESLGITTPKTPAESKNTE